MSLGRDCRRHGRDHGEELFCRPGLSARQRAVKPKNNASMIFLSPSFCLHPLCLLGLLLFIFRVVRVFRGLNLFPHPVGSLRSLPLCVKIPRVTVSVCTQTL